MKIKITLKDPDGPYDSMMEAAEAMAKAIPGLTEKEREGIAETRFQKIQDDCEKWLKYGEYLTVEIDTEAGTATVLPA